jgi:hypothetical protein
MMRLIALLLMLTAGAAGAQAPADSTVAAVDSLDIYWRGLDSDWYEPLTLEDLDLSESLYDSLLQAGNSELKIMYAGRPWRFDPNWINRLGFNRVQGPIVGAGLSIDRPGVHQPQLDLNAAYGFAWKKGIYSGELRLPLHVGAPQDAQGRYLRNPWRIWELDLSAGSEAVMFAGDSDNSYDLNAFLGGYDPNHYFKSKHARVGVKYRPERRLTLTAGVGAAQHYSLRERTDWSLLGAAEDVEMNMPIDGLKRQTIDTGFTWRGLEHEIKGFMAWHRIKDTPLQHVTTSSDGSAWYQQVKVSGFISRRDPWANIWMLSGKYGSMNHSAPLEWKTWLGDVGSLRGYELLELGGDSGGAVSLDIRGNFEPFKALRIPLLKNWRIRPILFADYGGTTVKPDTQLPFGQSGWRADVGYGFGKMMGMIPEPMYLRFYAARPIGENTGDLGWRYVLVFELN